METPVGKRIKLDPRANASAAQMTTTSTNELGRKPKAAPPATVMDPDGDLLLRVGAELPGVQTTDFRVCSAAMRRASQVWKSMLFGPWSEAKPKKGTWVVNLPEDNPTALLVILTIIHGRFSDVPRGMWLPQLYDVLIALDKYDLMGLIQPWYKYWACVASNPPKTIIYRGSFPMPRGICHHEDAHRLGTRRPGGGRVWDDASRLHARVQENVVLVRR
jgi:hypothetical protein